MDFEESLKMVYNACRDMPPSRDNREIIRSATQIYLADLPRKNLLKRLQKAKEDIEDLSYYTCDGRAVDLDDVFKILDELMESVEK